MADAAAKDDVDVGPLDRILALAKAERDARNSPQWKFDMDAAIEKHSDFVERLYGELYRQIDERAADGVPISRWKAPPDATEELRKRITRALKADLPQMISEMVVQIIDQET